MKRLVYLLLAAWIGLALTSCTPPKRQPSPDYEKVRKDHKKADQDLRDEEDAKDEQSED